VVNYHWCEMRYKINQSMGEYIAGSSALRRKERPLISHSVGMKCGVSLHLWSMKITPGFETTQPASHTSHLSLLYAWIQMLGYGTGAHLHTLQWLYRSWKEYDIISPGTQQALYPVSRFAWVEIIHVCCACTTLQPQLIGGLCVEQLQWLLPSQPFA
jgi:hypothetical protein